MRVVVAAGTFTILHPGHLLYLREAKRLGDKLVVIVARDKTVRRLRGEVLVPEHQRLEVVRAVKWVDEALLGDEEDWLRPIEVIRPAVIALGKDQEVEEASLRAELTKRGLKAEVVRLDAYWEGELNSSKKIVERIRCCKLPSRGQGRGCPSKRSQRLPTSLLRQQQRRTSSPW